MYNPRPPACRGCPFDDFSHGFVPAVGPRDAPLAFLAEAPAKREVALSEPLVGESGAVMNRIFSWLQTARSGVKLGNVVNCMLPGAGEWHRDSMAPAAISHCHTAHLANLLDEPHKVIVTLGAIPTKHLLGLEGATNFSIKDFHGTVHRDYTDRYWVVPTFHPAHLLRGAWNLLGTMLHDIIRAQEIVRGGDAWRPAPEPKLTIDPDPEWWREWVKRFIELSKHDPGSFWLSVDSETDGKLKRGDEGELKAEDRGGKLVRTNVACGSEEGITVPAHPAYDEATKLLLSSPNPKMLWNGPFDTEVYDQAGMPLGGQRLDFMWAWHALHSDVPRGLGFAAPFYLPWLKAWKHLSAVDPATYAAWDGVNNHVIGMGVTGDLMKLGMWPVFYDHIHRADQQIFFPATRVGLLVDVPALTIYGAEVKASLDSLIVGLRDPTLVPESIRLLHPGGGWKKDPGEEKPDPDWGDEKEPAPQLPVLETRESTLVNVCLACGAEQIQKRHRCKDKGLTPQIKGEFREVSRWYVRRHFNPGSSPQLLSLIKHWNYPFIISKKSKKPTTEKLAIEEYARKTKDPKHKNYFEELLKWKEAKKVQGNYVNGTFKKLATDPRSKLDGRLHGETTHAPSTLRTCIASGTPVEVVRNVRATPQIAIENVQPGMLAYTFADNGSLMLQRVVAAWPTGIRKVVRLHWRTDSSKKRPGYVDLTPDHLVKRTNGEWTAAGDLQPGMRVVSLARCATKAGYQRLWPTGHGEIRREHRFVYAQVHGQEPLGVVHHKDENQANNLPDNLEEMLKGLHTKHHAIGRVLTEGQKERRRASLRYGAQFLPRGTDAMRLRRRLTKVWMTEVLWAAGGRPTVFRDEHRIDYNTAIKYLRYHGIDWRAIKKACKHNHVVVSVVELPDPVPVFDLEVEGVHNFVAGEICVHNSMRNPNLQNVTIRGSLSAGFRKCLVAAPGHKLVAADYSGIEALLVGWFARDPAYIRLAKLGVHAYLTSHVVGMPADLSWPDADLKPFLKQFKSSQFEEAYDQCKHVVHGTNYVLTPYGMAERFPKLFPTRTIAEKLQRLYFKLCPKLKAWQEEVKYQADRHHVIGGPGQHPFGYRHEYWNVRSLKPINQAQATWLEKHERPWLKLGGNYFAVKEGDDAKRAVAFYPQSTARGIAVEAGLRLTEPGENSLIGFGNGGDTPFRALIHDEWLLEVPDALVQEAVRRLVSEMCRPVKALPLDPSWWPGKETHLSVGVECFVGQNWDKRSGMEKFDISGIEIPEVWELVKDLDEVKREHEAEQDQDPDEEGYEESAHENAVRIALAG